MKDGMDLQIDPIRLWNTALSVLAEGLPLQGGGRAVVIASRDATETVGPTFRLKTAGGEIFAELHHLPLGAITQSALDLTSLSRLPPVLAEAILTRAMTLLLHQTARGAQTRIHSLATCKPEEMAGEEQLLLRIEGVWPETAEIRMRADRTAVYPLLLEFMPIRAKGQLPDAVASQIALPCSLRLAPRDLPLARLKSLRQGDILILNSARHVFHAPHAAFDLSHDGTNWIIGSLDMTNHAPPAEPNTQMAEAPASDIGEIPVRLSFVLSEHTMTVADLQNLTKGSYLPLDPSPGTMGQAVRILANGRAIGEGHVVELDNQPAVRIARLFGS